MTINYLDCRSLLTVGAGVAGGAGAGGEAGVGGGAPAPVLAQAAGLHQGGRVGHSYRLIPLLGHRGNRGN